MKFEIKVALVCFGVASLVLGLLVLGVFDGQAICKEIVDGRLETFRC